MTNTLVIQIPCFNEAGTLCQTLDDLPKAIDGIDRILVLVIDDGSTDGTAQIAATSGADYVVRHLSRRGLARAFMTGLTTAVALGADMIVNTDGDNQYPGRYIPELVKPILAGESDMVIGDRQTLKNEHFTIYKRWMENAGSWVVRKVSNTNVPDAASGFRAYSRQTALKLQVYNDYSYTLETLIQAGQEGMAISHIPIRTNPALRKSRLHRGMFNFLWNQSAAILRSFVIYQPLKSFFLLGLPFLLAGVLLIARFFLHYLEGQSGAARNIQSVSIGGTLSIFGILLILIGMLGDAVRANRKIMEEILVRQRDQFRLKDGPTLETGDSLITQRDMNNNKSQGEDKND